MGPFGKELVKFQNGAVAIVQDGMRGDVFGLSAEWIGGKFFLYVGDLWYLQHKNCLGSIQRRKLGGRHKVAQHAITNEIKESMGKFEIYCA